MGLDLGQAYPACCASSGLAIPGPKDVTIITDMLSGGCRDEKTYQKIQGSLQISGGSGRGRSLIGPEPPLLLKS